MIGKKISFRQIKHHWEIYLFLIPAVTLVFLFQYYPAFSGVWHSFFRWNGSDISEWQGLSNYINLFSNSQFWLSFEVACTIGVFNIIKMIPAVLVAVCIHRCVSGKVAFLYRVLFVFPMVIPSLVIVLIWRSFFFEATNGFLNKILYATGAFDILARMDSMLHWGGVFKIGSQPAWLGDPKLIVTSCIIWGFPWVGSFAVLTYLAKLQSISKDVYEAAAVDGVGWLTKFTCIEMPLILSNVKMLIVFVIIETIKDAGMILALAGMEGGPGGVATVPALFMLRKAFIDQDMGFACAVGIVLTALVLIMQKACNIITSWDEFGPGRKLFMRAAALALGAALLCCGKFTTLGCALLISALPFYLARDAWAFVSEKLSSYSHSGSPAATRTDGRFRRLAEKICDKLLRCLKHLTIWAVLFSALLPLYLMLVVSLKDNTQFYESPASVTPPFHWENWVTAWDLITPTLANSLFISILSTVVTIFCALCAAYFFARHKMPLSGFFWNAILILMMMPSIANLVPLFNLLKDMSLLNTLTALIIVGAAAGQTFAIFVLRTFIEEIPRDLFEAAEIDGAGHFTQMCIVVVPLSGPILGTVGVMHFIAQWNDFVLPLIVIRDQARLPVMVQLLRMAGEYIKLWGPLMAGYALASVVVIILFIFAMKLFTKGLTDGAIKQ